jgi:hypothetical protein
MNYAFIPPQTANEKNILGAVKAIKCSIIDFLNGKKIIFHFRRIKIKRKPQEIFFTRGI